MSDEINRSQTNTSPNASLIDISVMVDDVWKEFLSLWWVLLFLLSIFSSAFYFREKFNYTPEYVASATYTVDVNSVYDYMSTYYNQTTATDLGITLQYLLTSATMQTIVAEDLGVSAVPGTISVSVMENTNLITINATASNPQTAYSIFQSVIANYPSVAEFILGDTVLEVMDETGIPEFPSNPENAKGAARTGFLLGIVVDFIMLMVLALTKRTIKKEEDFKQILNVECYGAVPAARFKRRGKSHNASADAVLIDNYRIPSGFIEAIRSIRTKLEQDAREKHYKVFLVSSSIAGEGKTTVSANLALALARKGKRVILVDMDLRSPAISKQLCLRKREYGTVDLLKKKVEIGDVLKGYKDTNLQVIAGGRSVYQTMTLLNSSVVPELLEKLRSMADYVIVDTPPCAMLSDATAIAPYVDAAIYVVRQDYARINDIMEGVQNLAYEEIPLCGCVLNQAEVGITGYGYGQGYGYGRYGYGYGEKRYGYGYGGYGYGADVMTVSTKEDDSESKLEGEESEETVEKLEKAVEEPNLEEEKSAKIPASAITEIDFKEKELTAAQANQDLAEGEEKELLSERKANPEENKIVSERKWFIFRKTESRGRKKASKNKKKNNKSH